jgi:hypothetical protein
LIIEPLKDSTINPALQRKTGNRKKGAKNAEKSPFNIFKEK